MMYGNDALSRKNLQSFVEGINEVFINATVNDPQRGRCVLLCCLCNNFNAPPLVLISILICKPETRIRLDISPRRKFEISDAHVRTDKHP